MTKDENKIKVFASDDNLKSLGELLSNETSRKIIMNLMASEMYTNEIATKLDIRVSLVIHHLRKLEELGLLEIIDKKIKRKGEKHKFFKMNFDIFITLDKNKDEIKENGILKRIFKEGIKLCSVFLVTVVGISIFTKANITKPREIIHDNDDIILDLVKIPIENITTFQYEWIIIPIVVIISSVIFIFLKKRKKGE